MWAQLPWTMPMPGSAKWGTDRRRKSAAGTKSALGIRRRRLGAAALALPLLSAHLGLLLVFDLAHHLMATLALLGAAFLALLYAARRLEASKAPLGGAILAGALLLRLPLLPLPPTLSDDALRYLWDG